MHTGKPILLVLMAQICISITAISQSVGIGTTTPAASAQLEVSSTNRGLLLPRMTKTQRNAIASPADGLLVFQTGPDSVGFYYRFGGAWIWLQNASGPGSGWSTTGNIGMVFGTNYLGTRDNAPLIFGVNSGYAGGIGIRNNINLGRGAGFLTYPSTGSNNIAIGDSALYNNNKGTANIAIGTQALKSNLGANNNIAIGDSALSNNKTGFNNISIGTLSANQNISGNFNTYIGNQSGLYNKRGSANVSIGQSSMFSDTSGSENVAVGAGALGNNLARNGNTAVGFQALLYNAYTVNTPLPSTQGLNNTAIGHSALLYNRRGSGGVALGYQALYSDTAADGTVAIGRNALYNNIGGKGNIAIGDSALIRLGQNIVSPSQGASNIGIGNKVFYRNQAGRDNTIIGTETMLNNQVGNGNTVIGAFAMRSNTNGSNNTIIGSSAGINNIIGTGNVFIGALAGSNESASSGQLFIENSAANKDNALIYGDFDNDSLLLNGKTIIKSRLGLQESGANTGLELGYGIVGKDVNAGRIGYALFTPNTIDFYGAGTTLNTRAIKFWAEGGSTFTGSVDVNGYVRLGRTTDGAPAIKTRKLTGTGPEVNGTRAFSHGLNAAKILQVSVLMEYGLGAAETIPANYTSSAGYQYEWQVRANDIFIINRNGNSANIGNRPVRILITYEE